MMAATAERPSHREGSVSFFFFNPFFLLLVLNNVSDNTLLFFLSTVSEQVLGLICGVVNTYMKK
jgi:hypothetical protein